LIINKKLNTVEIYIYLIVTSSTTLGLSALFGLSVPFILPTIGIMSGMAGLVASVKVYKEKKKDGTLFQNELEIRRTLDTIIQNSLNSFENQDYKKFFTDLTVRFDKNSSKEQSLICVDFEEKKFDINPKEIIKNMHIHGFRPEAIAYLLNLIFEALLAAIFDPDLKDDFNTMGIFDIQIKCKILDLLNSITEKPNKNEINLEEEAEKLDTKLREMQSRMIIEESFWGRKIKNKYFSFINYYKTQGILDDKLINDSNQITFKGRFNEVRNIAKINKIIYALLVENNEKILEICIDDIQKSLDNFTYINKAHLRFEILKDFIWLFTGSIILKEKLQENLKDETQLIINVKKNLLDNVNVSEDLKIIVSEAKSFEKLALVINNNFKLT
jgi:hypothetical protein